MTTLYASIKEAQIKKFRLLDYVEQDQVTL